MKNTIMSPLAIAFNAFEATLPGRFQPNRKFYKLVEINQKRFGQLLRGDADMSVREAKKLAEILQIPITDLL